ncbi:type II toxin-antitoxin system PemK/MazF family toxin [Halomonas sp. PA5]|nr:type II toxin-antitoxin system PemK/MazF family toxin [Halomonas sp. PA5]
MTRCGMTCQSGDVVLIPFPFSDLQSRKRRPVLVLRPADRYGDMVCLAITSSPQHADALILEESSFAAGTLPKRSWVRYEKVFTLNDSLVVGHFGALTPAAFKKVLQLFCKHFGC